VWPNMTGMTCGATSRAPSSRKAMQAAGREGDAPFARLTRLRHVAAVLTLREWLAAGPYTLAMSSGFFGFFAHAGVVSVLEDEGLSPARICGSSAGALVGGLWAAGLPAALIREQLLALRREQFWDVRPGLGLLRGARFRERLDELAPAATIEGCRVPLAVSVYDMQARGTAVLRSGELAPAIHASCALPFLFQPVRIGGRFYLDGGVLDRPGLAGAGEGERVLHHHLTSRSPWRRRDSPALRVPDRPLLQAMALTGIPRLGPFRLERGREAIERAAEGARRELDRTVG
jgi:NTE family protein